MRSVSCYCGVDGDLPQEGELSRLHLALVFADEVEEELVDAGVVAQLGVEGGGKEVAFADEDGVGVASGEGFDFLSSAGDTGGADEDHLERAAGELGIDLEDGGVDLTAVGVALNRHIEGSEGLLHWVGDVLCEEDDSGAGSEGRGGLDEGLQGLEETALLEELEHCGGLSAGHDETVDSFKVVRETDEPGVGAEAAESEGMGLVGSLEGEDAYDRRVFRVWLCCRVHPPIPTFLCKVFEKMNLGSYFLCEPLLLKRLTAIFVATSSIESWRE